MVRDPRALDPDHDMYDWAATELARWRRAMRASHADVGKIINRERSLISKFESGESRLQEPSAEALDAAWGTGGLFARIVRLAKSRHSAEWGAERTEIESQAVQFRIWALGWIPALAQTEEYARAAMTEAGRLNAEQAVKQRMDRQKGLDRAPAPLVWLLIDQDALEHEVGGPDVHRRHLPASWSWPTFLPGRSGWSRATRVGT